MRCRRKQNLLERRIPTLRTPYGVLIDEILLEVAIMPFDRRGVDEVAEMLFEVPAFLMVFGVQIVGVNIGVHGVE